MSKIYRVLGKKGRVTVPFEIRLRQKFSCNDILSFEEQEDGSVLIRREKLCDHCMTAVTEKESSLLDVINSLNTTEQKAAFRYLAKKLSKQGGDR